MRRRSSARSFPGGEKIRLLFARIFVNPPNFLVLDEPTTHLDIAARELLQEALKSYPGTVCVVSHDIEFVRNVATGIIAMESPGIRKYFGNYDYYLEKSAELRAAGLTDTPEQEMQIGSPDLARNRRRARAQARNALAARKKTAEQKVADLEKKLEALEKRQAELVEQLSGDGKVDFASVNRELVQVQRSLEQGMADWETAASELEEIRLENERIHQELN